MVQRSLLLCGGWIGVAWMLSTGNVQAQAVMANSLDSIPGGWTGKVFKLSKAYPTALPTNQPQPWKTINFKTQPLAYINAVKAYVLAGNVEKDWVLQNNTVRTWYHTPSMIWGANGREFINGLTRERSSRPRELHPNQTSFWQNWAVGFYNPAGGFTIGQVYQNPTNPNAARATFPEGTVAAKLLFTNAPISQVPYLQDAFTWQANIHTAQSGTTQRSPATLSLLQMDIAVKDNRASASTDWVMMTFAYHKDAPGATPWDKLVPVGLQWGNDPTKLAPGDVLTQTWINPAFKSQFTVGNWRMHTGFRGRLNGPVDNPVSSCLSCHGTGQFPRVSTMVPDTTSPASLTSFFRNINPPAVFEDKPNVTEKSLDYSLQFAVGIPLAGTGGPSAPDPGSSPMALSDQQDTASVQNLKVFLTTRDLEDESELNETDSSQTPDGSDSASSGDSGILPWVLGGVAALGIGSYFLLKKK